MTTAVVVPKVFISYSWTSEDHKAWVLDLSTRLREHGIDVILDRWHLEEGHDKYVFMERMVNDSSIGRVLMVCDRKYAEKADGRAGGVGTETQIITPEVYAKADQTKFIALVRERDENGKEFLPTYLKPLKYIDFSDDAAYETAYDQLMRRLHHAPEIKLPPLGKPPAHIYADPLAVCSTSPNFRRFKAAVESGKATVAALRRGYLEALSDALAELRIIGPTPSDVAADEHVVNTIARMRPYRDEFIEFCLLYANNSPGDEEAYADVHDFMERLLVLCHPTELQHCWSDWQFDAQRFTSREFVLYLLAALTRSRQYKTAARFMDDRYQYVEPHNLQSRSRTLDAFNEYPKSLDEARKQRLGLQPASVSGDMLKEWATHPRITFRDLIHTDLLLAVRGPMIGAASEFDWYPRLLPFADSVGPLIAPKVTLDAFTASVQATSPLRVVRGHSMSWHKPGRACARSGDPRAGHRRGCSASPTLPPARHQMTRQTPRTVRLCRRRCGPTALQVNSPPASVSTPPTTRRTRPATAPRGAYRDRARTAPTAERRRVPAGRGRRGVDARNRPAARPGAPAGAASHRPRGGPDWPAGGRVRLPEAGGRGTRPGPPHPARRPGADRGGSVERLGPGPPRRPARLPRLLGAARTAGPPITAPTPLAPRRPAAEDHEPHGVNATASLN